MQCVIFNTININVQYNTIMCMCVLMCNSNISNVCNTVIQYFYNMQYNTM